MEHRELVIDDAEAKTVRHLFDRYLLLKSVRDPADEAARDGLVTRTSERQDGTVSVTMPFGRGNLYHLLSNPIYVGKIKHKDQVHDGEHEPIKRRGVKIRIVLSDASSGSAEPDAALIDVVHRSRLYLHPLTDGSGRSLTEIADFNATTVRSAGCYPWRSCRR